MRVSGCERLRSVRIMPQPTRATCLLVEGPPTLRSSSASLRVRCATSTSRLRPARRARRRSRCRAILRGRPRRALPVARPEAVKTAPECRRRQEPASGRVAGPRANRSLCRRCMTANSQWRALGPGRRRRLSSRRTAEGLQHELIGAVQVGGEQPGIGVATAAAGREGRLGSACLARSWTREGIDGCELSFGESAKGDQFMVWRKAAVATVGAVRNISAANWVYTGHDPGSGGERGRRLQPSGRVKRWTRMSRGEHTEANARAGRRLPDAVDEITLIDQVAGGDMTAFETLFRRYYPGSDDSSSRRPGGRSWSMKS